MQAEHMSRRIVVFTDTDGDEFPVAVDTYSDEGALRVAMGWAQEFIADEKWRPNGELKLARIEVAPRHGAP